MKWKMGDMVHGFRVNSMSHIEEVNSDAYLMEHVKSSARLMYLDKCIPLLCRERCPYRTVYLIGQKPYELLVT